MGRPSFVSAALLVTGIALSGCAHEQGGMSADGWATLFDGSSMKDWYPVGDANSGIYMRCGNPMVFTDKICYEANIFDERKDPSYGTGAVTNFAKVSPMPKAGGKWSTYDITVKGTHIVLVLDGVKTAEVDDSTLKAGHIALQYAQGVVKFRKIRIKEL